MCLIARLYARLCLLVLVCRRDFLCLFACRRANYARKAACSQVPGRPLVVVGSACLQLPACPVLLGFGRGRLAGRAVMAPTVYALRLVLPDGDLDHVDPRRRDHSASR